MRADSALIPARHRPPPPTPMPAQINEKLERVALEHALRQLVRAVAEQDGTLPDALNEAMLTLASIDKHRAAA